MRSTLAALSITVLQLYPLQAMEGEEKFTKKIDYVRKTKKVSGITITDQHTLTEYKISKDEAVEMIQESGKIRKEKQAAANNNYPLVNNKIIKFTSNINAEKKTEEYPLYLINNREDKRKGRDLIQKFFDESQQGKKPEPLFLQMGPDENTDVNIIRSGLDIAVSPLRKSAKKEEGYLAKKPPAYGSDVDESSKSLQKALKLVEGSRSKSAPVLRHIAKKDDDFIGKVKGGAKKLRNFDEGKVSKADEEKVLNSLADHYIDKLSMNENPPHIIEINHQIKCDLATETDSASFLVVSEKGDTTENYGYNEYIRPCFEGEFKENLIRLKGNDPNLTKFVMDRSSDAYNGTLNIEAVSWAISHNTVLEKFDCSFNNTNDTGARALAGMLKTNTTLLELDLTNNHIGGGVAYLAEAMIQNTSLIYMNLSYNGKMGWWGDALESILSSINRNRELKNLPPVESLTDGYKVKDAKTSNGGKHRRNSKG